MNKLKLIKAIEIFALIFLGLNLASILFVIWLTPVLAITTSEVLISQVNGTTPSIQVVADFIIAWGLRWLIFFDFVLLYLVSKLWRKKNENK